MLFCPTFYYNLCPLPLGLNKKFAVVHCTEGVYPEGSETDNQGARGRNLLPVLMCRKYIQHLKKVLPAVIEGEGAATGLKF